MTTLTDRIVNLQNMVTARVVTRCLRALRAHRTALRAADDAEIALKCQQLLLTPKLTVTRDHPLRPLLGKGLEDRDAYALALVCEAFSRFPPAGLPLGSELYDEQLLAAVHLLRGAIVQMDTGEGKTFAVVAAAFAMLRIHSRVYVVTANPYLAMRDAGWTAPFWESCGIRVGLALPSSFRGYERADWQADVVYTTLEALVARALNEELDSPRTIQWSAAILDEADEVLLDQAPLHTNMVRYTDPSRKDWSSAIEIAASLGDDDVVVDLKETSTALTPSGEQRVMVLAQAGTAPLADRLLLMHDVELAYTALRVARAGHDYEVLEGGLVTVDPASGWHMPTIRPRWTAPLAQILGVADNPRSTVLHMVDGMTVLRRFNHVAALSGTVINEALDYLLLLQLPSALIRPRVPRRNSLLPDLMAKSEDAAHEWIARQVVAEGLRRPFLIATDTTSEAFRLADHIAARAPGVVVRAVTGETIVGERVFEAAGRPGFTVVSTRVSGRGVDIVLTPTARTNGGAALISVGHAREARLDRQLLGRVGRCGDPYTAQFINHPDTDLARLAGADRRLRAIADRLIDEDEPVGAKMLTRQLRRTQRAIRLAHMSQFASSVYEGGSDAKDYEMLSAWRRELGPPDGDAVTTVFLRYLVDRLLDTRYPGLAQYEEGRFDPEQAASEVAMLAGSAEGGGPLAVRTVGQARDVVRRTFTEYLHEALRRATERNSERRAEIIARRTAGERAVLDKQVLLVLRDLAEKKSRNGVITPIDALATVLDGYRLGASARVQFGLVTKRGADVGDWIQHGCSPVDEGGNIAGSASSITATGDDDDVAACVLDLAELILGTTEVTALRQEAVSTMVEHAVNQRFDDIEALDTRWGLLAGRSSRAIVSETLGKATDRFEMARSQQRFQLAQAVPPSRFVRVYSAAMEKLRLETEATMASEVCANLVAGADPAQLDALFADSEHEVVVAQTQTEILLPRLSSPTPGRLAGGPSSPSDPQLILDYYQALTERLGDHAPEKERLWPALIWLAEHHPAGTLTDRDLVASAFNEWKSSDARTDLLPPWPPWRRRDVDRHVRGYFAFLHERGLAAPLPSGPVQVTLSVARRMRSTVRDSAPILGLAGIALAAAALSILALLPHQPTVALSPALAFGDRLLTLGALSAGSPVAVGIIAIVSAIWAKAVLGVPATTPAGLPAGERLVSIGLLVATAALVSGIARHGLSAHAPRELLVLVLCVVLALVARNGLWFTEALTQSRVSAGLAGACALFGAVPFVATLGGVARIAPIMVVSAVVLVATRPLRRTALPGVAIRVDQRREEKEVLKVQLIIRSPLSVTPHLYAFACAWLVSCVVISGPSVGRSVSAGCAYALVLAVWARAQAGRAADPGSWHGRMRAMDQAYEPGSDGPALEDALVLARRRIAVYELVATVPLVALATVLSARVPLRVDSVLPVGLAALFVTVVTLDFGRVFLRSLQTFIGGVAATRSYDEEYDAPELADSIRQTVRYLTKRLSLAVIVFAALTKVVDVLGVTDLITEVAKWVWKTVT